MGYLCAAYEYDDDAMFLLSPISISFVDVQPICNEQALINE